MKKNGKHAEKIKVGNKYNNTWAKKNKVIHMNGYVAKQKKPTI